MKVVLSYSGGLDTTVCIPLLKEKYGFDEVITVTVDIGQPEADIKQAEERGKKYADKHYTIDAKKEFVDSLFMLIKANGNYEGYVLGTALARPLIAEKVVEVAKKEGAEAVAHGCTGKGNDQLRFENIFRQHGFKVIAPVRELNLTREWEIEYARQHGIEVPATKEKPYSIDENLWSRSVEGGKLEDPSFEPPEDIYEWTASPEKAPDKPEIVKIDFEKGVPVALNDERMGGFELIKALNEIGGKHGVGRTDMIEDRVLGLKARENYEHPAATILITAHRDLENLVLSRRELKFKKFVEEEWAELVYYGLVNDPLFDALNAFIDKTQERVTGWVKVKLYKGSAVVVARNSPYALYSEELVSFDTESIDQRLAEGFAAFHGLQGRLFRRLFQ
ncbi:MULTISPECIES: argininosuccinate synthase [Archaeoglobus]|jgi:argininosuccinate synthase|uniref:Argininosuccinate synthase n=3 Tax=Archaeoglobus fulgidus TaxID=2234 RepID=ASSY_ARCFU|nr:MULTISPECIES: argininosuccinate synthase [Archaeoglobus]O28032.1 RecName: Full=Argininosuccinate synthase; AltName: Full=Citrulline--aspartate ligase [Archaeoglobus fulgidus DSM 4304]AAB89005.1 argininosuccinate synthetase (argG) [Archaeoglobus fulgidus DSM 4304]AIG99259.1 argininosuccinate synthase [Archaeoglobus fulgidus DSM 8774]KUJ93258.1 MAG: Argininosuccinate synthase [Archaeoglobus fulgidus]KUK06924.1 MAG: Argininosuccinate synthase [Archaeoglobus fulgidus]MDI3497420.1 argininosucci